MKPKYAELDDVPVRYTDREAWQCIGGVWSPLNTADAHHKAKMLSEETYNKHFPQLPPLPTAAFQSSDSES
jgi:hypothetical protein